VGFGKNLIDQHVTAYNAAVAPKQHYYYPFDDIWRYDFSDIIQIIDDCAITEAEMVTVRQMYDDNHGNNDDNGVRSPEERLDLVGRRSAAVAKRAR
jgi:hypothetical protein